jgi:hypothetical protein
MNIYLQNFIQYFEQVIHPAGGGYDNAKTKKKNLKNNYSYTASPESFNIRGGVIKKQEKLRRNPAP